MMPNHPSVVSVIIPAHNSAGHIAACLKSLLVNSYPPDEIIVVDDASTDGVRDVVRSLGDHRINLVRVEHRAGAGGARNKGIELAQGELLFFIDADCTAAMDWIERGIEGFQDQNTVGVYGPIFYSSIPSRLKDRIPVNPFYHSHATNPISGRYPDFAAANVAYRAAVARRLGGFNTDKFRDGREDTDLGFRAQRLGPVSYLPEFQVTHAEGSWSWRHLHASAKRYAYDVTFFATYREFIFRRGRVLHPRMLLMAICPVSIPIYYRRWLRTSGDWAFLFPLWVYFWLVRWHILRGAWRERVLVF